MLSKTLFAAAVIGALAACAENPASPVAQRTPANADRGVAPNFPFAYSTFALPVIDGGPLFGITGGPDGNAWVTDAGVNEIIRVTSDGTVTEFPLPTDDANPLDIGLGPDGALWFSEYNVNAIARITVSGDVTQYPLPASLVAAGGGPRGVITGPDHNVWFVHDAGYVGKLSPAGDVLAIYPTPTPASGAVTIALGPDGALWFTEANVNQIGRVTMAGTITEYAIPTAGSVPVGIVAGKDGAMYFTERTASQIGRITMTGQVTEFPTPTPNARPQRIAALPNGNVWFVESNLGNGHLGRVLAGGKNVREYVLPAPSVPFALAAIGDHTLWFTDGAVGVGKVTVGDDQ